MIIRAKLKPKLLVNEVIIIVPVFVQCLTSCLWLFTYFDIMIAIVVCLYAAYIVRLLMQMKHNRIKNNNIILYPQFLDNKLTGSMLSNGCYPCCRAWPRHRFPHPGPSRSTHHQQMRRSQERRRGDTSHRLNLPARKVNKMVTFMVSFVGRVTDCWCKGPEFDSRPIGNKRIA